MGFTCLSVRGFSVSIGQQALLTNGSSFDSSRWLELDPSGYFIIKIDRDAKEIVADHYTNTINKNGLACDPDTGEACMRLHGRVAVYTSHLCYAGMLMCICSALEGWGRMRNKLNINRMIA